MSSRLNEWIEPLEGRQLLSADGFPGPSPLPDAPAGATVQPLAVHASSSGHKAGRASHAPPSDTAALTTALSVQDVGNVIAQAASQAKSTQVIAVVDREGTLLGLYGGGGIDATSAAALPLQTFDSDIVFRAVTRARTAAQFQSRGEAFTTRTARFIIQNHFPQPIRNTPGGPLYGVEFSRPVR